MTLNPARNRSDPLLAAVVAAQERHQFFAQPSGTPAIVVVAVSGGADSVCLLHVLHTLAPGWGLTLHVAHVDHGLRPTAAGDARFVAELAATLGLTYHAIVLDPQALRDDPAGLEAAARHARYLFLRTVALDVTVAGQVPCVAVAHHAGDQAETVLMRLVQGAGLRGLGGMQPVAYLPDAAQAQPVPATDLTDTAKAQPMSETELPAAHKVQHPKVRLVRPLLGLERASILGYLERHALAWREDETNRDIQFLRNRLRQQVIPVLEELNPNLVGTLARTASVLAAEAERSAAIDRSQLQELVTEPMSASRVVLDLMRWRVTDLATRRGTLRAALETLGVDERVVGYTHIETIVEHAQGASTSSGPHPLAGEWAWSIVGATPAQPARLCLHRAAGLPIAVTHPWLAAPVRVSVPIGGSVTVGDWVLHATNLATAELPADWHRNRDPWRMFADAEHVGEPMLATPEPGQVYEPLGMRGQHKHVGDLFTDAKTPATLRAGWPLLVDRTSGRVLWVCGHQPSEQVRVTGETRQVINFWWSPTEASETDASGRQSTDPLGHL